MADVTEAALILAVRDKLRDNMGGTWKDREITEDRDELAAAITGDKHIAVWPGGVRPGPFHGSSGTVRDQIVSVNVSLIQRAPRVPKDRDQELYLAYTNSMAATIWQIMEHIDWEYDVLNTANTTITAQEGGSPCGFNHPLVWTSMDNMPRQVTAEFFDGKKGGELRAGLVKRITFGDARRTEGL